jgi:hypothetical protein
LLPDAGPDSEPPPYNRLGHAQSRKNRRRVAHVADFRRLLRRHEPKDTYPSASEDFNCKAIKSSQKEAKKLQLERGVDPVLCID